MEPKTEDGIIARLFGTYFGSNPEIVVNVILPASSLIPSGKRRILGKNKGIETS